MPPERTIIFVLGGLCVLLFALMAHFKRQVGRLAEQVEQEKSRQKSLSTTYGNISEQWFPLLKRYPYNPQDFRFLGSPVDGVQFNEDSIIFVEFKANKSRLSEKQRRIKKLVEEGHVYWEEFHFTEAEK